MANQRFQVNGIFRAIYAAAGYTAQWNEFQSRISLSCCIYANVVSQVSMRSRLPFNEKTNLWQLWRAKTFVGFWKKKRNKFVLNWLLADWNGQFYDPLHVCRGKQTIFKCPLLGHRKCVSHIRSCEGTPNMHVQRKSCKRHGSQPKSNSDFIASAYKTRV